MTAKILIIDDEDLFREDLATVLRREGHECRTVASAEEGLVQVAEFAPDIILSDIVMPGKSGIEILDEVQRLHPDSSVIIMTAFGTLETAIEAFRKGAVDYVLKPLVIEDVLNKLRGILEHKRLLQEIKYLRREVVEDIESLPFVGQSESMQKVIKLIEKVAPTNSTVVISGESGTGKELVARAIHQYGENRTEPFIAINCSGLQESLLESELFGHLKGAFTGAVKDKKGFFEVSGNGTILLDEISAMPGALQSKLLRVLEQREFYRVGGTEAIPLRARIIAATNNNLKELIRSGQFREDLFYRIAVFEIYLPPLRERRSDIPLLVEYFVRKFNQDMKRKCFGPTTETMQALLGCNWRGNVRELRNVVERAMILCDGGHITPACLPPEISGVASLVLKTNNLRDAMHAYEQTHIRKVLTECEWNKEEAARRLGINPSTLYRKIASLRIENPPFEEE